MEELLHSKSAVIKLGTESAQQKGVIENLVDQMVCVGKHIERMLLVTSGAMGFGRAKYGREKRDDESDEEKRANATAGQSRLMRKYEDRFEDVHKWVAHQILVTRELLSSDKGCEKLIGTLEWIFHEQIRSIPVVNENDAIADDEIKFSDNDQLALMLARLVRTDAMVLLTDVNGVQKVYGDPETVIPEIAIEDQIKNRQYVLSRTSKKNGMGGMPSKYDVSCEAAKDGIYSVIGHAADPHILEKIFITGERVGTVFLPDKKRKAMIAGLKIDMVRFPELAENIGILLRRIDRPVHDSYTDMVNGIAIMELRRELLARGSKTLDLS